MAEDCEGDVPYVFSHKSREFRIIAEDHSVDPAQKGGRRQMAMSRPCAFMGRR